MAEKKSENYKPEWTPDNAGSEFASSVMPGVEDCGAPVAAPRSFKRREISVDEYVEGVLRGDRRILAQAITVVESNSEKHFKLGQEIIRRILPHTGNSVRVGITGVPGAGKSTFIECFGNMLCDRGRRVAVLAVDPTSAISRGSILGDKTRMEKLARRPEAFIRPSPSGGTLGGVTRKSRETMLLCEAAGFDTILVETVGVGQNETSVRAMVDFFLVITIAGAGDDLQGIKKGVIETADAILVNKADGDNKQRAQAARAEYEQVLRYLRPATEGWTTGAYTCSAITGEGVDGIWNVILGFIKQTKRTGVLESRRGQQTMEWVKSMTDDYIRTMIYSNPRVQKCMDELSGQVMSGEMPPTLAAKELIDTIEAALKA